MLTNTSSDFDLTIRQQPDRARVAGGKEKGTFFCLLPAASVSVHLACSALSASLKLADSGVEWGEAGGAEWKPLKVEYRPLIEPSYRAQTHRSAPDRPAQGARGGLLSSTVSVAGPFEVTRAVRLTSLLTPLPGTTCKVRTISCAAACTMLQKIVLCLSHPRLPWQGPWCRLFTG